MGFELYKKQVRASRYEPVVSFRGRRLYFNHKAVINCELEEKPRVLIHIDDEERKMGFEFTDDLKNPYAYFITPSQQGKRATVKIQGLLADYPWIQAIARLKKTEDRQFPLTEDPKEGLWVIQLIPAFEITTGDINSIPMSAKGIYRYLGGSGEVIYIGEGNVRERYHEPERRQWPISEIGYSIVNDEAKRKSYESFWLDHYKKHHEGSLPVHNSVSGITE